MSRMDWAKASSRNRVQERGGDRVTPEDRLWQQWDIQPRVALDALTVSVHGCANFCAECGAESWHLKGTDVDTCRRGHHKPCPRP